MCFDFTWHGQGGVKLTVRHGLAEMHRYVQSSSPSWRHFRFRWERRSYDSHMDSICGIIRKLFILAVVEFCSFMSAVVWFA